MERCGSEREGRRERELTPSLEARMRVKTTQPITPAISSRTIASTTAPAVFMASLFGRSRPDNVRNKRATC